MEDYKIVELYFVRSEEAIVQTDVKYGGLAVISQAIFFAVHRIAKNA